MAWIMMRVVHHRYTISHPKGIYYSNIGDYITAFMYQPVINLILVIFAILAFIIIYLVIYLTIEKIFEKRSLKLFYYLLNFSFAIYLSILGFIYFQELSLFFFIVMTYLLLIRYIKSKKRRIKRITDY